MRRGLLVGLIVLLAAGGCRNGPTMVEIGLNNPNVVIAFGDSISDGYDSYNGMGYRDDLERLFAEDGRIGVRVLDEGEPGTYSADGVERITEVLLRTRPAVMILLYGTNDEHSNLPQSLYAAVVATTSWNLRQIIGAARANNTIVVLSTIPPVCTEEREFQRENIVTMNEKIREIGKELHRDDPGVILADAWDTFLAEAPPDGCGLILMDHGNHPNESGYGVLAGTYYEALKDINWE